MTTPAPIPDAAQRILVFGGSFDPPHTAHFRLPELVRAQLGADHILYIPAARSPHKASAPGASAELRAAMLHAGLTGNHHASVWTVETDRTKSDPAAPSYTIDTLRELRRQRPSIRLRLLIGQDQARDFHRWREPSAILRLARPAVMLRQDAPSSGGVSDLINQLTRIWGNDMARHWASWVVPVPLFEISATRIREHLAGWDGSTPDPELERALPQPVLEILTRDNPYRTTP